MHPLALLPPAGGSAARRWSVSRRATFWQPYAKIVLDKGSLTVGVDLLRQNPKLGLVVLVNRYDGVDLPGDACHVLVVDGLPEALSGTERIDQAQLAGTELLIARQVQRLEQGMGRATRSNDDHCVVILLGNRLAERLYGTKARECFSPATRAQIELSDQVAAQLEVTGLESLRDAALQCLGRDADWLAISRAALAPLRYGSANVSAMSVASREAFDCAAAGEFHDALTAMQAAVDAAPGLVIYEDRPVLECQGRRRDSTPRPGVVSGQPPVAWATPPICHFSTGILHRPLGG
ncbi:MAG TPA: helicase C-terminal domain-containing protein [Propionibacteriaceae bacterium]|nr:helicase C-terminal domain-containing protein [Propionibacteriaceae bacterium]